MNANPENSRDENAKPRPRTEGLIGTIPGETADSMKEVFPTTGATTPSALAPEDDMVRGRLSARIEAAVHGALGFA